MNNLVGRNLSHRLDFKVEFIGFRIVVERFVGEGWFFPFGVTGGGPFLGGGFFVPEGCVAKFVVGVVFEGDGCDGGPFCVFFCDALMLEMGGGSWGKPFWRHILFGVLDLDGVYI